MAKLPSLLPSLIIKDDWMNLMPTLIMCKGIPGSGKSYWAEDYKRSNPNPDDVIIVTRDDIRDEYGCGSEGWSKDKEGYVIEEMKRRIRLGLRAGKTVISGDTNLKFHHEDMMRGIAKTCAANFVVKFFDTDLLTCIERDKQRVGNRKVGEHNIRRYHDVLMQNTNDQIGDDN